MTIARISAQRGSGFSNARLNNRWWIVAASLIGLVVGEGPVNLFCFGVFLKPVSDDLGLSRGTLSSALLTASVATAIATPIVGALIDRYGSRAVMLPGIAAFAIAVTARATLQSSPVVWVYALFLLAGLSGAVQTPIVYAANVCRWFDRQRGLALGIAMAGTGVGVLLVPQAVNFVVHGVGWRSGYLILGAMIFLCAFIPVALFMRDPSADAAAGGNFASTGAKVPGLTLGQAVKKWQFWCLSIAFLVGAASIFGTFTHAVAILTDRGMDSRSASAALSIAGLAMVAGRIAAGYGLDLMPGPSIAVASYLVPTAGIALLASGAAGGAPFVAVIMCGLGQGAQVGLQPFFASRHFGLKSVGAISGAMFSLFLVGAGLGPYLSGACFDRWTSYGPVLIAYGIALGVASLLFICLGPPPFAVGSKKRHQP
jgi:MFS family permease